MKRMIALSPALLAGLMIAGCGSSIEPWVGTWEGSRAGLTVKDLEDDIAAQVRKVRVTINPDRTFELVELSQTSSGTVRLEGEKATLTITKSLDKIVDPRDVVLQKTSDTKAQFWNGSSLTPGYVELTLKKP